MASSGKASGSTPTLPPLFPRTGDFFGTNFLKAQGTISPADGECYAVPFSVGVTTTVSQIDVKVTTAGGASSVARVGIAADDGTFHPGALVVDAGTVGCSTTGIKSATGLSTVLTKGLVYWFLVAAQGGGGAVPVFTGEVAPLPPMVMGDNSANSGFLFNGTAGSAECGFKQTGVSGALPATFTGTTRVNTVICVFGLAA